MVMLHSLRRLRLSGKVVTNMESGFVTSMRPPADG